MTATLERNDIHVSYDDLEDTSLSEFNLEEWAEDLRCGFEALLQKDSVQLIKMKCEEENCVEKHCKDDDVIIITYGNELHELPESQLAAIMQDALLIEETYSGEVEGVEQAQRRVFSWNKACESMKEAGALYWDDKIEAKCEGCAPALGRQALAA